MQGNVAHKAALVLLSLAAGAVTLFGWLCAADSVDDLIRRPLKPSDYVLCFVTAPLTVLGLAALSGLVFWKARRLSQHFSWPHFGVLALAWAASVFAWFTLVLALTFVDQLLIHRGSLYRKFAEVMPLTGEKLIMGFILPIAGGACALAAAAVWAVIRERLEEPAAWQELMPKFARAGVLGVACGAYLQPAVLHLAGCLFGYGRTAGAALAGYTLALVAAAFALAWIGRKAGQGVGRLLGRATGSLAAALLLGIGVGLFGAVLLLGLALVQDFDKTMDALARDFNILIVFAPFLFGGQAVIGAACLAGGGWLYWACLREREFTPAQLVDS